MTSKSPANLSDGDVAPRELADLAASLGFFPDDAAIRGLAVYLALLMHRNKAMNLVGARTWQDALRTLVVDSLHLAPFLERLPLPASPLCWDPGAGAGLPGIPLRLVWNRGEYWMIEAREKRALFLSTVLDRLDLPGTHVYRGRLERFLAERPAGQAPADLILSRAFMPWRDLLALAGGKLGKDGLIVLLLHELPPPSAWAAPYGGQYWRIQAYLPYQAGDAGRVMCAVRRTTG
jgi:16S rRNA (guanine527-N7)-methyltransferase